MVELHRVNMVPTRWKKIRCQYGGQTPGLCLVSTWWAYSESVKLSPRGRHLPEPTNFTEFEIAESCSCEFRDFYNSDHAIGLSMENPPRRCSVAIVGGVLVPTLVVGCGRHIMVHDLRVKFVRCQLGGAPRVHRVGRHRINEIISTWLTPS